MQNDEGAPESTPCQTTTVRLQKSYRAPTTMLRDGP